MTIHTIFGTCINVWHILVRSTFCVMRLCVGVMMNINCLQVFFVSFS